MVAKIGIDFHGVISAAPELFAKFCHEIRKKGVAVYVISGGPKRDILHYLDEHKVEYDEVWAILDFYEKQGKVEFFDDGSFKVDTKLWNEAKAKYCAEQNILFHIDDSAVYGRYFVTPYCQYDICHGACELDGFKINFNDAERAAEEVAEYIRKYSAD